MDWVPMSSDSHFDSNPDIGHYEALLSMADLIVHHHSLPQLFAEMAERLRKVTAAEFANFSLYDSTKNVMRLYLWEGQELGATPLEVSVQESPAGWAWQNQQPLLVHDIETDPRFPPSPQPAAGERIALVLLVAADHRTKTIGRAGAGQFSDQCLWREGSAAPAAGSRTDRDSRGKRTYP
jgi:GAF domain-containing protein